MEYVDIYNENREKTGDIREKWSPLGENEFIMIAHVVIINSKGQMIIQKRANDKKDWPGCWDITSGGGVMAGETCKEAAERELFEELGIKVSLKGIRPMMTIDYPLGFDDIYLLKMDINLEDITAQKGEVLDVCLASKEEILKMMDEGKFVRYRDGFINLLFAFTQGRGSYER